MSSVIPWFEVPAIRVAGLTVTLPDVLAVLGALVALVTCRRRAASAGLSPRRALDVLAAVMLSAAVAGRLSEAVYYPEQLATSWRILLPWQGGLSSLGVFLGTAVALALLGRFCHPERRWRYLDVMVPAGLLGGIVVRLGCFLGHHHAGRLSTWPGTVAYPGGARFDLGLCEALLMLAIVIGSIVAEKRLRPKPGRLAMTGVAAYAMGRFALEYLRGDDLESIGRRSDARYVGLTLVQYAVLGLAAIAATWLWRAGRRTKLDQGSGDLT